MLKLCTWKVKYIEFCQSVSFFLSLGSLYRKNVELGKVNYLSLVIVYLNNRGMKVDCKFVKN